MFHFCLCVTVLMLTCSVAPSAVIPDGVLHMECHERYFMIAVDLSFTGEELRFEAVDERNVYPVTEQYGAQNGYTVRVLPLQDLVELRASYFSPHTKNKDDQMFTFQFNLVVVRNNVEVSYALSETCSPSLPWSPREVTCEANYMEVTVRSALTCTSGMYKDDWDSLKMAHSSTTSDWQVMFQQGEQQHSPMTVSQASEQGYVFYLTTGRLVFRTPYGQPHALTTQVTGVPVEVVSVTIYSRQSWVVLMVDLVAACSVDEGSPDGDRVVWRTPEALYPSLSIVDVSVGLNGQLLEQPAAEMKGYTVQKRDSVFQIGVPFDANGRFRKSFVNGSLFHFYVFHVYVEQILLDEGQEETRLRLQRTVTAVVQCPLLTEDRTVVAEETFTAYLGELPEDVVLAAVELNGEEYLLPFANASGQTIAQVTYGNNTHGYTLRVPFDHPAVVKELSEDEALLKHVLHIQYALVVLPENATYYHPATITVVDPHLTPPDVAAACLDTGIGFTLTHRPFSALWQVTVGSAVLTSDLATRRGYALSNDSRSLELRVPLFTPGYTYTNITLESFSGTFEISVRRPDASEALGSFSKMCSFSLSEYVFCSKDGTLTVTVDLSTVVGSVANAATAHLLNQSCTPTVSEGPRVQFSFYLNSCGTTAKADGDTLTYENEIFLPELSGSRLVVQCSYPGMGLHQLSSTFQSDADGTGTLVHTKPGDPTTAPSPARLTQLLANVSPSKPAERRSFKAAAARRAEGFLDQVRGELDKLYFKIRRWVSENCQM